MKLTRRSLVGGLAGAFLYARALHADGELPLDPLLADIAKARADLRTLTGPFTQTRTIGLLAAKVRSNGTLMLARPDRLRWELLPPDAVTYWVGPEGLAYKSKTGQGRVQGGNVKVAAALDDLRVLLGGDLALLRARYDLKATGTAGGPVTLEATPRAGIEVPSVQRLLLTLGPDRALPTAITIVETAKDRTEITFGVLTKNATLDPGLLRPPF